MQNKVNELLDLIAGKPGRHLEDDKSFFGQKDVSSDMKNAKMQTDCGGMIITKASLTYGKADEIATQVNLADAAKFIRNRTANCYWNPKDGIAYHGEMLWAIYSYLATKNLIPDKDPSGYNNSMEYLYDQILLKLVENNYFPLILIEQRYGSQSYYSLKNKEKRSWFNMFKKLFLFAALCLVASSANAQWRPYRFRPPVVIQVPPVAPICRPPTVVVYPYGYRYPIIRRYPVVIMPPAYYYHGFYGW